MTSAQSLPFRSGDWTLRPFERTALAPIWVGAGIFFAFLALALLVWSVLGRANVPYVLGTSEHPIVYLCLELLNATIFSFIPTATAYAQRGALSDLGALRPVLRCDAAEFEALQRQLTRVGATRLALAGAIGAVLFAWMVFFDSGFWLHGRPEATSPLFLWVLARHTATGWLAGHAVATELHLTGTLSRIGRRFAEVDLLDLSALRPFARKGQRSAFAWILLSVLVSCYWLSPSAGRSNPFILALILLCVGFAFVGPALGVHLAIRERKRSELERVRDQIRVQRGTVLSSRDAAGGRLADLIAYRDLVERVREWPWDVPTLLRLALYVSVGVGSWLGGAVVERLLGLVLG